MFIPLCLLGLFAFGSCRPVVHRQVSGKVFSIEGSGQRKIDGKTTNLTTSTWRKPGETIMSSGDSRIVQRAQLLRLWLPGAYTAIVSGKNGGTGVALVEIYEL